MRLHKQTVALLAIASMLNAKPCLAQETEEMSAPAVSIPDTEVHSIRSQYVEADFELWIARPQPGFVPLPDEPLRVLYVLDANLFFATAVEMTRLMHKLYGELPPLLVVGVAYPTSDGLLQGALRTRDFTPSEDPGVASMSARFPESPEVSAINPRTGGSARFLDFLQNEVKPFIAARFEVREGGGTIFGSSLGGLFVTNAFHDAPTAFDNFIAVSPALWWNAEEVFERDVPALGENQNVQFFIAVGSLEETPAIPALAPYKMVTNARRMEARLRGQSGDGATVHYVSLEGESHTSVVPVALTRALRAVMRR